MILAEDQHQRPALFQIGANALAFTGHPGMKSAIIEDLVMEFAESPEDPGPELEALRAAQPHVATSLAQMMVGLIQMTGWMRSEGDDSP